MLTKRHTIQIMYQDFAKHGKFLSSMSMPTFHE